MTSNAQASSQVQNAPAAVDNSLVDIAIAQSAVQPRQLASGRSVHVKTVGAEESVEIRSPGGDVELTIVLTDQGPVVKLRGATLEMEATEKLSMSCKQLDLRAEDNARIECGKLDIQADDNVKVYSDEQVMIACRETRILSSDDIMLNGNSVRMQAV